MRGIERLALEHDLALLWRFERCQQAGERGLAAAAFAHDADIVPRHHVEGDAAHGLHFVVGIEVAGAAHPVSALHVTHRHHRLVRRAGAGGGRLRADPDARDLLDDALHIRRGGGAHDVGHAALLHQLAVLQHQDAVRHLVERRQGGAEEQHADAMARRQLLQQADDLQRDGDVQRLGDVVGDDDGGLGRQRIDDHRALHHAAGILRRVFVEALGRRRNAHLGEELQDLLFGLLLRELGLDRAQLLHQLRADGNGGIEAALRARADVADLAARVQQQPAIRREDAAALEADVAPAEAQRGGQPVGQRAGKDGLAAARFREDAQHLMRGEVEGDAVENGGALLVEGADGEVLNAEDRRGHQLAPP